MDQTTKGILKNHRVDGVAEYHYGLPFNGGTGLAVYEPDFGTPMQGLIGHARSCGSLSAVFQPPQVFVDPNRVINGYPDTLGNFDVLSPSEGI